MKKQGVNVTLKIRYNRTDSSIEAYEATYRYCPWNSSAFSSRTNIHPNKVLLDSKEFQDICENQAYIISDYRNEKGEITTVA